MTPHIHHTSRKSMATGNAWGRLLTIAFLCLLFIVSVFAQDVFAGPITINIPDGINEVRVKNSLNDATIFSCPPTCNQSYTGTVYLEAIASTGWTFSHWTGGPSDGTNINPSDRYILPPTPLDVTAIFVRNPRSLTLAVNDSSVGGADGRKRFDLEQPGGSAPALSPTCTGTWLALTATATLPGWKFDSWSGSGAGLCGGGGSASTTVTMPDADIELTANFVRNPRSLTLAVNDSSVGGADGRQRFDLGQPGRKCARHFHLRVRGRG